MNMKGPKNKKVRIPTDDCRATVFDRENNELAQFPAARTLCPVSGDMMLDLDRDYAVGKMTQGAYGVCWNYYHAGMVTSAIECLYY